jgi:hypothetical protein
LPLVAFTILTPMAAWHSSSDDTQMGIAGIVGKDQSMSVLVRTCLRAYSKKELVLTVGIAARPAQEGTTIESFRQARPLSLREQGSCDCMRSGFR